MTRTIISFTVFTVIGGFLVGDLNGCDLALALSTGTSQVEHLILLRLELHDARIHHEVMHLVHVVLVLKGLFDL
jgi:hypothetical protein